MFIGEYSHTLDPKKRLALPVRFRKELGNKVVITRGLDRCLFMYPLSSWEEISKKLRALPIGGVDTRGLSRFMLSGAVEVEVDGAGRILIPDFQKRFASLGNKVVLAGVSDRIELWNEKAWSAYTKRIEKDADRMAQKLGDLGVL